MPVILQAPDSAPLTQGDILKGLPFATTSADGKLQADAKARYVVVVSRPCKALRDPFVVVAPVHESKLDLSQLRERMTSAGKGAGEQVSLDRARRFLAGVRDGGQFSDSFYLGDLEMGSGKRFAADLSALSTMQVPTDAEIRSAWVKDHRIWRLDIEFARDLHVRLFNTIARLGFDDHGWFADPDLDIIITDGEKEVAQLQTALSDAQRAVQSRQANGDNIQKDLSDQVTQKEIAVADAKEQLAPYLAERERRKKPAAQ